MTQEYGKVKSIILAENDPQVRADLTRVLLRLAEVVEPFADGENALAYAKSNDAELVVLSVGCWNNVEEAIKAIRGATYIDRKRTVICAHKMMPRHFNQFRKMGITQLFGYPMEPVYLFRIVHELYGIIARRYLRINHKSPVFWGDGERREFIGETMDISRGGMRLLTERKMSVGASLYWGIQLDENTCVSGRGEILKCDETTYAPKIAYGITFVEWPTNTAVLLEEAINMYVEEGAEVADISFMDEGK